MQVVLLESVAKLGQAGSLATVKNGYARNFLIPQGKALKATKAAIEKVESMRADLEKKNAAQREDAEKVAKSLNGTEVVILSSAGEGGQLYGSVASKDILSGLSEKGFSITKHQLVLDQTIKALGIYTFTVVLHADVACTIDVNVAKTKEEAGQQRTALIESQKDQAAA